MEKYVYIREHGETGGVCCSVSPIVIPESKTCILIDGSDEKYDVVRKYIECCYFEDGEVKIDLPKAIGTVMAEVDASVTYNLAVLRKMLLEAMAMADTDTMDKIKDSIQMVKDVRTQDFSYITSIEKLEELMIPELSVDYTEAYTNELFR